MRMAASVLLPLVLTSIALAAPPSGDPLPSGAPAFLRSGAGDRTVHCDTTYTVSIVRSFEMVTNADGAIRDVVGFDVTPPPTDRGAYSSDWYRDVLQGSGSVLDLPDGMQAARGWYFVVAGPSSVTSHQYAEERWTRSGLHRDILLGNTYELRFTDRPNKAFLAFTTSALIDVPFEVWCLRSTPAGKADDVRMIPFVYDDDGTDDFDFKLDHEASGEDNDPYSDWIYFVMPEDSIPGEAGYDAFVEAAENGTYGGEGIEHLARVVLMNWDRHQGESAPGAGDGPIGAMPETGTTIRLRFHDVPDTVSTDIACRTVIDINRWRVALSADGVWAEDADGDGGPGGEWPKDSLKYVIYAGGSYVGSMKGTEPSVSQIEWRSEFQPGDILNETPAPIDSLVASDPADPLNRVFVIDSTRTGPDWEDWPADKGAPVDPNGDPLLVSDQDSWTVMNDIDASRHFQSTDPVLGVEIQRSTYGFAAEGAVDNAFFIRWRVTNKSSSTYDETYFGIWMDPDLREANDDLIGIDTLRSMAFVYNGYDMAGGYVAMGLDLLRGPDGDQGSPLPLTSFTRMINGTDPSDDRQRYFFLRGLDGEGNERPNGPFDLPGDPVTGHGWVDSEPGDRRWLLASGPFVLHPGETKEILAACFAATGSSRLDAIVQLRLADDVVESVFDRAAGTVSAAGTASTAPLLEREEEASLSHGRPNPFTRSTVFSYVLPREGSVSVDLWNVIGQRVRTLLDNESRSAGIHSVIWDGRDQGGRRVASGLYLCRLAVGGRAASTSRVLVVR